MSVSLCLSGLNITEVKTSSFISVIDKTRDTTKSGIKNGLELLFDLGYKSKIIFMPFLYPFCNLSETFDNADITHEDALNIIINNEDNYPTFDLEGLIFRYNLILIKSITP